MRIALTIGPNTVEIERHDVAEVMGELTHSYFGEADATWGKIAEHLFFPALRALGYVIDEDFVAELEDTHGEYLDPFNKKGQ